MFLFCLSYIIVYLLYFGPDWDRSSGVAKVGEGRTRPGAQVLGAHEHTFCSH